MELQLNRISLGGIETLGIMGVVNENGATLFTVDTLERPYLDNQKEVSCIPAGVYNCTKIEATTRIPYQHISINNVPNRDGICIHKANFVGQLEGCIAVGLDFKDINADGNLDVTQSGDAFEKIMSFLPNEFKLTIK